MPQRPILRSALLPMALALAACQAAPVVAPGQTESNVNLTARPGSAGIVSSGAGLNGGGAVAGGANGAAGVNGAATGAGGVGTNAPGGEAGANGAGGLVSNNSGGNLAASVAWRDRLLTSAQATSVGAKAGGTVQSPDGQVALILPPGALSADAQVRLVAVPANEADYPNVVMSGLRFALDLGGAQIAPDQALKVRGKANPAFVRELQKRDPNFAPEKYSLSQDAQGAWIMEMSVKGPASVSPAVPTTAVASANFRLAEFGHLPFAPSDAAAAAPKYALMLTWAQQKFEEAYGRPAPNNMDEWFAYEHAGLFDCGTIEGSCWGMQLLHEMGWGVPAQNCADMTPPIVRVGVPVEARYSSDDPSVDNQPAAGVTVTWNLAQSSVNGPAQVIADGQGRANTFTAENSQVQAMAQTHVGPRAGAWVGATATQNMAPIALRVPLMSPEIHLAVATDGAPLPETLQLQATLDGQPQSIDVRLSAPGTASATANFRVRVPDNQAHSFSLTGVNSADLTFKAAEPEALGIQRNGSHNLRLSLIGNAPK